MLYLIILEYKKTSIRKKDEELVVPPLLAEKQLTLAIWNGYFILSQVTMRQFAKSYCIIWFGLEARKSIHL